MELFDNFVAAQVDGFKIACSETEVFRTGLLWAKMWLPAPVLQGAFGFFRFFL